MRRRAFLSGLIALSLPSLAMANPILPLRLELDEKIYKWSGYANSEYGCCVISTCAQAICIWSYSNGESYIVPDNYIIDRWAKITGYQKGDRDEKHKKIGVNIVTALEEWKKGWDVGLLRKSILIDYAPIRFYNKESLKWAIDLYGGCVAIFSCPPNVMNTQTNWCKVGNKKAKRTLSHATFMVGYDDAYENCDGSIGAAKVISWGVSRYVSWNFIQEYTSEAYILLGEEWVAKGMSPTGMSRETLLTMLQFIKADK